MATYKAERLPVNTIGALAAHFAERPERELYAHEGEFVTQNGVQAEFAVGALVAYAKRTKEAGEELETVFADLLGSLRHLADALGVDYPTADARGRQFYEDEVAGVL